MNDLGFGIVGLGRLGQVHAENISKQIPDARLVALCDIREDLVREKSRELNCKGYTDLEKMLENPEIDTVCVATPTEFHVDPVRLVAEAGKALFCEKPLASNLDDTEELVKIIMDSGILCQIGFNRRFDPPYQEARRIIEEGGIGIPVHYYGISRDPIPPPPWACDPARGGGLFIDMLLHDFDAARFLLGDEVTTVFGDTTNMVVNSEGMKEFADNVTASLHFKGGALAQCHGSMHARYGYDIRTEVYGEKGSLVIGGLNQVDLQLFSVEGGIAKPITYQTRDGSPHFMYRFKESYREELRAFTGSVLSGKRPSVTEQDALEAFRVSMAALESSRRGVPVTVLHQTQA